MVRVRHVLLACVALMGGCVGELIEVPDEGGPGEETEDLAPLELTVNAPVYGEFTGGDSVLVEGTVVPLSAELWIEDEAVEVTEEGAFSVELPIEGDYRIVDVLASSGDEEQSERIPVFSGNPPADTWTGGLTGRLLPAGMERLGPQIGPMIDDLGWADSIAPSLPSYSGNYLTLTPTGITHDETTVELAAAEQGIEATATLDDVLVDYDLQIDVGGSYTVPIVVGYGVISVTALVTPSLDGDGIIWLSLSEAAVDLGDTELEFGDLEGWILEWLLDILNDYVTEPLGQMLLDYLLADYGSFELGGPISQEMEFMGTTLAIDLSGLWSDLDGTALMLSMDMGTDPAIDPADMPAPTEDDSPDADVAVAVHEALLDAFISEEVLAMLEQDLVLEGTLGKVIGTAIVNLPGGGDAPDADGWSFSLWPGEAHVVRLQSGIEPLAVLVMPDVRFDVEAIVDGSSEEWLEASLAVMAGITVEDGTKLSFDVEVPEGAVTDYETTDEYDEDEVIAGLAEMIGSLMSLAGGLIEIDLMDLLGGADVLGMPLNDLAVVDSAPLTDADGEELEGLYAVALRLFPDE